MRKTVLVIDDDPIQGRLLKAHLEECDFEPIVINNPVEAAKYLDKCDEHPGLKAVLVDLVMPKMGGMEFLQRFAGKHSDIPFIVITSNASISTAVEAMRAGATDFVIKPVVLERLKTTLQNVCTVQTLRRENAKLKRRCSNKMVFNDMIADDIAMKPVIEQAKKAAVSNIPILISGESGVGKEVMARAIQGSSARHSRPFVTVNCGAIPDNLVESILFGHEKGSFTGAYDRHIGKFEEANNGTLFLDEIGELKLDMQVKLLRVLQEGEIDRVGGKRSIPVDVRIISATNRDLFAQVEEGKFREDLYYRLNVFEIYLPPLRQRRSDIAALSQHFLEKITAEEGRSILSLADDVIDCLENYDWPGNIRQLENVIYRSIIMATGKEAINLPDLPPHLRSVQKGHHTSVA